MNNASIIATYDKVQSLVVDLKQADSLLYSTKNMNFEQLQSHISSEAETLLQNYADETKMTMSDRESVHKVLVGLIDRLQGMEKLTVTTAIGLSNDFIAKLHIWFKKNLGIEVAIENYVDRKILGGLLIWWKGSYIDLSLSPKVVNI